MHKIQQKGFVAQVSVLPVQFKPMSSLHRKSDLTAAGLWVDLISLQKLSLTAFPTKIYNKRWPIVFGSVKPITNAYFIKPENMKACCPANCPKAPVWKPFTSVSCGSMHRRLLFNFWDWQTDQTDKGHSPHFFTENQMKTANQHELQGKLLDGIRHWNGLQGRRQCSEQRRSRVCISA